MRSADYLAYLAVELLWSGQGAAQLGWMGLALASIAGMCVWQARAHDRRRDALARVSRADPLTGCLNRRGFEERLDAELSRAARAGRPLGVVMLDLGTPDAGAQPDAADELLEWALEVMGDAVRPDGLDRADRGAALRASSRPAPGATTARRSRAACVTRSASARRHRRASPAFRPMGWTATSSSATPSASWTCRGSAATAAAGATSGAARRS